MKRIIARLMFLIDHFVLRCRWLWWCNTSEWLYGTFDELKNL